MPETSKKRKRSQDESSKQASIRVAIREGDGLILKDGPFESLKDNDAWEIRKLRQSAVEAMLWSREWDVLSKAHRVYYTCPIKFDLTKLPFGEWLPEDEEISRQKFAALKPPPGGIEGAFTPALEYFEPTFEMIPDEDLDARFKAFDKAVLKKLKEFASDDWLDSVTIPLKAKPPVLMRPEATESRVVELFNEYIIGPNRNIFQDAGLNIDYCVEPETIATRPDLVVRSEEELQRHKEPHRYSLGTPNYETLLVCEYKPRGLIHMVKDGEIAISEALMSILRQCVAYMLAYSTDLVLLSDFETSILLELNFPKNASKEDKEIIEIPLRYRVIDIEDTPYTLQAVFASTVFSKLNATKESKKRSMRQITTLCERILKTVFDAVQNDKENDIREDCHNDSGYERCHNKVETLEKTFKNREDVYDLIAKQEKIHYREIYLLESKRHITPLQDGYYYWSQVLQVNKYLVPPIFTWLDSRGIKGDYVLKVYDYFRLALYFGDYGKDMGFYSKQDFKDFAMVKAIVEMKCYLRIQEYNDDSENLEKIKSPELYDYGNMYVVRDTDPQLGTVIHLGPYLLMSYVKNTNYNLPISEIEKDGVRQLELLHSIGIQHGSVYPRNYFVLKDGVHFFDFSSARIRSEEITGLVAHNEIDKFKDLLRKSRSGSQ